MQQNQTGGDPAAEWDRLRPVIDDALRALGERDREAVLLRFFEGRAFADVGARLQLTADAARMRVDRALERMRLVLARRGVTSTTSALSLALASQAGAAVPAGVTAMVTSSALAGAAMGAVTTTFTLMSTMKTGLAAVALALSAVW